MMNIPAPFFTRLFTLALLLAAGLFSSACEKEDTTDYAKVDESIIQKYLADNMITNAQKQPSGLYYVPVTTLPNNTRATAGRTVSVLYTGMLMDGTVFDATSRRNNRPFSFMLGRGQVIQGWDEGIALMRKGERGVLLIPSGLGYGKPGSPPSIPANAVLRFEVELVDVQ
ncbi:hypothetical protein GCM10023185_23710 [Hymenobacter saemangeumensis]|uniref:Peptidyl-prolyl cis-trans isomerase n=1 Tax=Hymenobacter saemangeumensis TaxID=1084522 RepID=A0ABP8IGM6_9BACT